MSELDNTNKLKKSKKFEAYDAIIDIMRQDEFRNLFDKCFNDISEIKSILVIMKTYQYLENVFEKKNNSKPSREFMYQGIRKLMADSEARQFLVNSTIEFMNDQDKFENIINKNILDPNLLEL